MQTFTATEVGSPEPDELSYGEGSIQFYWPDPIYGREGLRLELDGHCSRCSSFRSGTGLRGFELIRDSIILRFEPALAAKLELTAEVEIRFEISDDAFRHLQDALGFVAAVHGWSQKEPS